MKTIVRLIIGIFVGAVCGCILGAALLGISTYMNTRSGWLGTERSWTPVAIYIGAICGVVPGTLIGLIVGATKCGKRVGALVGAAVGLPIALYLLIATTELDQEVRAWGVSAIPLGAVVGFAAAAVTGIFNPDKAENETKSP